MVSNHSYGNKSLELRLGRGVWLQGHSSSWTRFVRTNKSKKLSFELVHHDDEAARTGKTETVHLTLEDEMVLASWLLESIRQKLDAIEKHSS